MKYAIDILLHGFFTTIKDADSEDDALEQAKDEFQKSISSLPSGYDLEPEMVYTELENGDSVEHEY